MACQPCWFSLPWILNKSPTVSSAKHLHNITPPPPCCMVGTTHVETICSSFSASHKEMTSGTKNLKFWHINKSTDFHCSSVHSLCFLAQRPLFIFLLFLCNGSNSTKRVWFTQSPLNCRCWHVFATSSLSSIYVGSNLRCCFNLWFLGLVTLMNVFSAAEIFLSWYSWEPGFIMCLIVFVTALKDTFKSSWYFPNWFTFSWVVLARIWIRTVVK